MDGRDTLAVVLAVYESATTGHAVTLREVKESAESRHCHGRHHSAARPPDAGVRDSHSRGRRDPLNIPSVSYTHLRAHETRHDLVCRLLLEKKKKKKTQKTQEQDIQKNSDDQKQEPNTQ